MTRSVDEVLADPLPEGVEAHQVVEMVVVCEYIDIESGATMLGFQRTAGHTGPWRHVGMLQTVSDQLRYDLIDRDED